jgi:hypothetical protein
VLQWERGDFYTKEERRLIGNLARLADKAVREYRATGDALSRFVAERPTESHQSMAIEGQDSAPSRA